MLTGFLWLPQMSQQMSGMTLNGAGGQVAFGQPPTAMSGWAATGSGQTLSTQLWKWASVAASRWGQVRDEVTDSTNYTLCFSAPHCDEVKKLVPISITDQPSEHETCISFFFFPIPFICLSFSLLCEWIGSHPGLQPGTFCLSYGSFFDHDFYFPFLEKKKKENYNYKEITAPEKNDIDISRKLQDQLHELLLYHCIIIRL